MTQGQSLISTSVTDIRGGVISDLKTLDVLSDGLDDTDSLVTGDKGELSHELSLVDVLVGSTDSAEDDCRGAKGWSAQCQGVIGSSGRSEGFVLTLQEDLIVGDFGDRDSSDLELFGLRRIRGRDCVTMVSFVQLELRINEKDGSLTPV